MNEHAATDHFVAFVGIDWADEEHEVCLLSPVGRITETLPQRAEAIGQWVQTLRQQFGEGLIAVAVEQQRGALIHVLMQYENLLLFPLNPKQLARYREARAPSGPKDDPTDASLLAEFVRNYHPTMRRWKPDEPRTRKLARLCELRRQFVNQRTKFVQKLTDALKQYFPLALELAGTLTSEQALALLERWPSHQQLRRAHPDSLRRFWKKYYRRPERIEELVQRARNDLPLTSDGAVVEPFEILTSALVQQLKALQRTIQQFDQRILQVMNQHEDAEIFRSLPGAGAALAPRLLVAFGTDRERYEHAAEVQSYSGTAPVTKRSGKSLQVQRRFACPKFLRQTFHEFADQARRFSRWSQAYYQLLRQRGKGHQAAIRALAFKWTRIIISLWKTRTPYEEDRYIQQLQRRNSPVVQFLTKTTATT
jgi:transposase